MKKIMLALLSVLLGSNFAQAQLSEVLQAELEKHPNKLHAVRISYPSFIDFSSLKADFDAKSLSSAQRAKVVNRLLMQQAKTWQANTHQILQSYTADDVGFVQSFYIVNQIVASLSKRAITNIASLPEVQSIDLALGDLIFDEPAQTQATSYKGATGPEPGLIAINAPAMWALGYTGRGRKVYVYDTGVWPTHPAFSNRFLGNFTPISEAWYGHYGQIPRDDNGSSHGTHVLGTIAGLDQAQTDTIGVAFNSYWMACDLIKGASQASQLPQQVYMIAAFEWALNPDGDTNTTDDIPDVINNSWRWRDVIDTAECNGMIPQLMNAIEAAGIANIFSGGNTGPNNNGVNSPQRINTTDINTFSVGSINANQSFPYPISSFSTRGPTQCAGTGSLKIHPEVVAPGQDVRSAWGTNGYNSISGTSMAAPHVSGALLLLKEAFPNLSGEVLMQALYDAAIDLGPTGEDNTYGRGLIDVYAAYLLLAQTNTPANPNDVAWDVAIKDVTYPGGDVYLCDSFFAPTIILENLGDSTVYDVELTIYENGNPVFGTPVLIPTQNFTSGSTFTLPTSYAFAVPPGENEWSFNIALNQPEYDIVNNNRFVRFTKLENGGLPLLADFENGLDKNTWQIENPDYSTTWDTVAVQGWPGNNTAVFLDASFYSPNSSQKDGLVTREISLPAAGTGANLAFDVAYRSRGSIAVLQDTLAVFLSEDCGQTFSALLYKKHGADLATVTGTGSFFSPADSSQWRRDYISLAAYAGKDVLLKFESTNRNGNSIYLDNISVYGGGFDPFTIEENSKTAFKLYPNPADGVLHIEIENARQLNFEIEVVDVNGRVMIQKTVEKAKSQLDVSGFARGVYFISIKDGERVERLKFVKM